VCSILKRINFRIVERRHAKPETAAPIKRPHIIPTVKAYRETLPASLVRENRPETNSGEIVAISKANNPPKSEDSREPSKMTRKNPIVVLIMIVGKASFWNIYSGLTPELSDSRPAVTTSVTLDNQSSSPKSATVELRSGAAVRSSDFVSPFGSHS
jgi:hypothetical protein